MIVEHTDYATNLHDLIASLNLKIKSRVLEVGPGEGQLLSELSAKFKNLVALDNSQEMLEKCKKTISLTGRKGVEFILGDTSTALNNNIVSDLVTVSYTHLTLPTIYAV